MTIKSKLKKFLAYVLVISLFSQIFISFTSINSKALSLSTSHQMEYLANGTWHSFNGILNPSITIDGLRIQSPNNGAYYLQYKTWNQGKSYAFPAVSSLDNGADDYAGMNGLPVEQFGISVYAADYGRKLTSGIVVMYRAYVNGEWLPWVSNATASEMQKTYNENNLTGALDTNSFFAGKRGSVLQGLEIKIFEGPIPESIIPSLSGKEYSPTLSYSIGNTTQISFSKSVNQQMDCLWIRTGVLKKYHLEYRVASAERWYPFVDSRENDYAGVAGKRISKLGIRVRDNSGNAINSGVVVMYRTRKTNGEWLPWVSNADPDWMILAQAKYNLGGLLDYNSSYAGLDDGSAITGVEIRVFEENSLNLSLKKGYKLISVPHIYQKTKFPTGCESVSAVMALNFFNVSTSVDTFVDKYLVKGDKNSFNPNTSFGGDPRSSSGMGCYAPVIKNAIDKAIAGKYLSSTVLYNQTLDSLCSTYIDNNIPVILWASIDMRKPYNGKQINYNGQTIQWIAPEHCLLLVGYDDNNYIFSDPMKSQSTTRYSKLSVITAYQGMGSQAVVIQRSGTKAPGGSSTQTNTPTIKPPSSAGSYIKPSIASGSNAADPIDLFTGGHSLNVNLLSLYGGQEIGVKAGYRSDRLVEGSMGVGWYHNYEKRIVENNDNTLFLYDNPSVYSIYTKEEDSNTYSCTTLSRNGYTITADETGYLLDCRSEHTERYDTSGRLIKITNHQGFDTNISYSDNLITVSDSVTGKSLFLEKNTDSLIGRVYDEAGRETTITYANGFLTAITDPNGNTLSYSYTDGGRVQTGFDDADVGYFENIYDASGRVIEQKDGNVPVGTTHIAYGENGLRTVTDRTGAVTTHIFDANGQLTSFTDALGNTTSYTYDQNLNLISQTDALGNSEYTAYNNFNLPVSKTDKNGNTVTLSYDENGNVTEILYPQKGDCNADGYLDIRDLVRLKKSIAAMTVVTGSYNADMNYDGSVNALDLTELRKAILCDGSKSAKETFIYNERNQVTQSTDRRGTVTTNTYDRNGMLSSVTVGERVTNLVHQGGFLTSKTDANQNTTAYGYNSIGQMTSVTDAEQNTTTYTYNAVGSVLSVTKSEDDTVSYTYDGNGQMRSQTDANGNTTWYEYNGNMKLATVTLPNGGKITYEYDAEDRLISTTDPEQNVSTVHYDRSGRKTEEIDALKNIISYTYDAVGNLLAKTDHSGGVVSSTYDAVGNALTVTDPAGNTASYLYDAFGQVVISTNAFGGITKYNYNSSGDVLSVENALGGKVTYSYDQYGNKTAETDARGNTTHYGYDNNNNLVSVTNALGQTTTNAYDSRNLLVSTTDSAGNTTTYGYDALGRRISVTDPNGHTTTQVLDPNGNVLSVIDAKGNVITSTEYNESNLAVSKTDATGIITSYEYSIGGNLLNTSKSYNAKDIEAVVLTQNYFYDALGRVTEVRDALGGISHATYNAVGSISKLTDAGGTVTNYSYDTSGRMTTASTPSGGLVRYTYNALNLQESITNARNQTRTYTYDLLGRVTGYTSVEGSASYTYGNNGNVLTATDQNGTVTREYDALNRVTKYTDVNGRTVKYEYDTVGRLSVLIYPDGTKVLYSYDDAGNLLSVSDMYEDPPGSHGGLIIGGSFDDVLLGTTSYTYDENNNCTSVTKPDGSVTTTVYDSAQRVSSTVEKTADGDIIIGYEYSYDSLGRISSETLLAENIRYDYAYDSLSRVISRTAVNLGTNESATENYTYDQAGNITSSVKGDTSEQLAYDENNRLVSFGNTPITYDADGNMISGLGMTLSFDSANRLLSAGGNTYTYDVESIRVKNLCGDTETEYTYDTTAELSRLLYKAENDSTVTKYIYGIGLIGEVSESGAKIYHFDYRGSTAAITDKDGEIIDTFSYDTYGRLENRTGTSAIIFLYNGRDGVVTDSNGLLYMRARYYSPVLKRFINADIIAGVITDPVTLNRYSYANGNPVSNIDPFGLSAERGQEAKINLDSTTDWNQLLKYYWKYQETLALYHENKFKESIFAWLFGTLKSNIESDYRHNSKYDIVGYSDKDFINDQNIENSPVSKLKLIDTSLSFNGCEVIAVFNAMLAIGKNPSMAELVKAFEKNNVVIANDYMLGALGSNPYGIGRVFDDLGIDYSKASFDDLKNEGTYVFSFWNSADYLSMIHTVAMQNDGKGNYITYNFYGNGKVTKKSPTKLLEHSLYITGYSFKK